MQTRKMRACGIAVGLLAALTSYGVSAETPDTRRPETSLLGIPLLSGYNAVLRKFGQPNEIQVGEPVISGQGMAAAATGQTGGMGGFPGMGGAGRGMGGRGMAGGYPGMGGGMGRMSGGPPMGYPGMGGSSGGPPMGYPGMGGSSGGPPMGYPGMGGSSGGGIPGMAGKGGGLPGLGGPPMGYPGMGGSSGGYPGMGGAAGAAGANTAEDSGETTWWYHFPHEGLHYSFLFNKEGKVIQIQAYGQKPASKIVAPRSAQGITLGTDFGQVISKYGWSNDGEHSGDYVVMRYSQEDRYGRKDRIAFQSRHNKVLGIVLGVVNKEAEAAMKAMTAGYPGGPGGYPGMGGPGMGTRGYPGGPGGGD